MGSRVEARRQREEDLDIWLGLGSRYFHCSEHFAGALTSENKEVVPSQILSRILTLPCFGTCAPLCFSLT